MSENKQHQISEGQDYILVSAERKPYWKRMHHSWIFWVFLTLMLAGIFYYILTIEFSLAPLH